MRIKLLLFFIVKENHLPRFIVRENHLPRFTVNPNDVAER